MKKPASNLITFPIKPAVNYPRTPTTQSVVKLATGRAGTVQTLAAMRRYVDEYKISPQVRELALRLVNNHRQKDYLAEIKSLYLYVKDSIRYTRDIYGVETVQTPVKTLEFKAGDCDDKSTLLATLLEAIGFETRFHAMGRGAGPVCHVMVEVRNPLTGMWIPLETTQDVSIGWLPPDIGTSIYYYSTGRVETLNGFGSSLKKAVSKVSSSVKKIASSSVKSVKALSTGDVKGVLKAEKDKVSGVNELRKNVTPKAARELGDKVGAPVVKVLGSKAGQSVLSVLSFIPVTAPFALAAQGAVVIAQAEAVRKHLSTLKSNEKKQVKQVLIQARYVYDPAISAIRERQPTGDESLTEFKYIDGKLIKLSDEESMNVKAELSPAQKKLLIDNTVAAVAVDYPDYAAQLKTQLYSAGLAGAQTGTTVALADLGFGWGEAFAQIATSVAGQYATGKVAEKFAKKEMDNQLKLMNAQLKLMPQTPPVQGQQSAIAKAQEQLSSFTSQNKTAIIIGAGIVIAALLIYLARKKR